MNVIVVNQHAKQLRGDTPLRRRIGVLFAMHARIIDVDGEHNVIAELDSLSRQTTITAIYVVGGDGTFNDILNWIITLPPDTMPSLMSVGGGQFCFMTRFHGLRSKNPIRNLKRIFSGKLNLRRMYWRPVRMDDEKSGTTLHGAVIANGVVCDLLKWYEDIGKGGFWKVLRVIFGAILSVLSDRIRRAIGRINLLKGELRLGGDVWIEPKNGYPGFAFGTVPELVTTCRPFRGRPNPREFYAVTYWGGLRSLAFGAPFIWSGRVPFWMESKLFNAPIRDASITTTDERLLIDGDLIRLPDSGQHRVLTFKAGEPIPLLEVEVNHWH